MNTEPLALLRSTLAPPFQLALLSFFLLCIVAEIVWSRRSGSAKYNPREAAANVGILAGMQVSKFLLAGWTVAVLAFTARFRFFTIESSWPAVIGAFVLIDFLYYWQHRLSHEVRFFWAFHLTHHSSPWMNLTTSFRLNWLFPLIMPFFYLPVALLGFDPLLVGPIFILNLIYQFWLHTESIGKLGWLEGVINTPSAHRVHHASNDAYIDKNYGGFLMVWDRLFGTYAAEGEPVRYGITTGFMGHNPIKLVFVGFYDLFRGRLGYKG